MLKFLTPDHQFDSITDIHRRWLKKKEIHFILLDLDRTLLAFRYKRVLPKLSAWLERKHNQGFRFVLLSNGWSRLERLAAEWDIPCFTPFSKLLPSSCRVVMRTLHLDPQYTAVISDRTWGSIAAANLAGIRSIRIKGVR